MSAGRQPKRWRNDPDVSVIVFADAVQKITPRMTRAAALKLVLLWHYHGEPVALRDGSGRDGFAPAPQGKDKDNPPGGGLSSIRGQARRGKGTAAVGRSGVRTVARARAADAPSSHARRSALDARRCQKLKQSF